MKSLVILTLATLLLVSTGTAADPFPAPVKESPGLVPGEVKTAGLPEPLKALLAKEETGAFLGDDGKLRETVEVLTLDLNADKEPEFLVWDPTSYTGGSMIHLFASAGKGCKALGAIQGEFYLAEPVGGYFQIVYTARSGGDVHERRLMVFKEGAYTETKTAEYQMNDQGELKFVKLLEP